MDPDPNKKLGVWIRIHMDIFGILNPDPHENLCGLETLEKRKQSKFYLASLIEMTDEEMDKFDEQRSLAMSTFSEVPGVTTCYARSPFISSSTVEQLALLLKCGFEFCGNLRKKKYFKIYLRAE